ncbi:hypothetical protein J6590_088643 [Homalodisca vitripennis]|nr:hypothetical protein J6590_088643 [Homalodisca vitripennis]
MSVDYKATIRPSHVHVQSPSITFAGLQEIQSTSLLNFEVSCRVPALASRSPLQSSSTDISAAFRKRTIAAILI